MSPNGTILSFNDVSFEFEHKRPLLDEVRFSVREGTKVTIMGQNGAGKSTIMKLITRELKPESGAINVVPGISVALSRQIMPPADRDLTVLEFFKKHHGKQAYDIDVHIDKVLKVVNLHAPKDRIVNSFSGRQQARLLLASALIQDPDLLLLDEPTNNLDKDGIAHLTEFLVMYPKTCIVISHDEDFLNAFTDGVLYLDVFTKKVEQYDGNYYDVQADIAARIEKENMLNARMAKGIQENKEKANFFAHKGGKLRLVAKKMREAAEEMEENKVDVRREDKTIHAFTIPAQEDLVGEIICLTSVSVIRDHKPVSRKVSVALRKKQHLLLSGPNGIGKSTLLESIAEGTAKGATVSGDAVIGYYRQDFSNLDFNQTVLQALSSVTKKPEQQIRALAAGFLITGEFITRKIGSLSEGQKGLVAFARLVLLEPGLLILDEPTNHINFRHLPVIAKALDEYEGAMILVSHVPDFVSRIRIDETLDLGK